MAPRKKTEEKEKPVSKATEKPAAKATANEAADMILDYLRDRPYSAIDVSANLHNKVTKAAAAKILKDLHERNEIEGRAAGKQIVYHAIQNPDDACTPSHLAALDTTTTSLRARTTTLLATAKSLRTTLTTLNSTLSTADLIASVTALKAEKAAVVARLESLRAGKAKKVTKREREEVDREWETYSRLSRKRAKIGKECWELIEGQLEGGEMRAEVREQLGLDE
ncbi:TBPIP-domain-containing protein [Bimuria novae-zelandiae CBS 107.79]|uniref:TBPIP-domain-containing protein n=1 Tax=Bimuria novae-zelandiae CBS 107.79 TaxID=1447943 RepID=A0A6A5VKQ4_9PLEO|nr:TBPIP-domain-containing protein [Bimuria novae-zelandiae CBS 107.79]